MAKIQICDVRKALLDRKTRIPTMLSWLRSKHRAGRRPVLDGVDLHCGPGELVELRGQNGAGKTTLLRLIAGIFCPDSGECLVQGSCFPVLSLNANYHPNLSVRHHAAFLLHYYGGPRKNLEKDVEALLRGVELRDRARESIRQLSPGLMARLLAGITQALAPDILLVDEILGQCDNQMKQIWEGLLVDLRNRGGIAVVVSHDEQKAPWVNRTVLLERGKLVESLTSGKK